MKFKLIEDLELSNEYDSEGNELTKAQAEFFKNSKVRDSKGRLLVCYHGTNKKFDIFERGDIGFHFGTKEQANSRNNILNNNNIIKVYLEIKNPYIFQRDLFQWDPWTICTYIAYGNNLLDNSKPRNYYINSLNKLTHLNNIEFNKYFNEITDIIKNFNNLDKNNYQNNYSYILRKIFNELGYDGIRYINEIEGSINDYTYIAFEPNQIKSITNKNPSNSNNINEDVNNEPKIIYMPLGRSKVEIIKNPTRKMLRDLDKEQRELHPNIKSYEPVIRFTYGENGNEYIWPAYDAMHDTVERYIYKTFGEKTNQSKSFELFDTYYDDLI